MERHPTSFGKIESKKPSVGVGVMVIKGNKILLGRRHKDAEKADSELHGEGTWTMPGGKLHFKEELKDAAFRELFEETGLEADKEELKMVSVTDDITEDAHFVTVGFSCRSFKGELQVKEPDEIVEWEWFELDKLPHPIFFPSKKIVDIFLERSAYDLKH